MKIYYVTGNKGKVDLINMIYKDMDIEVIQENIETPELQSLDCREVAKMSAEFAAKLLGKPVLKNDSGLVIDELNGFPGALAKYTEDTIGSEGYLKLLEGKKNRRCHWVEALAYCEPNKEAIVFESLSYGTISHEIRGERGDAFDKIFIPDGDTRTFAEMTTEEHLKSFDTKAYFEILKYLFKEQ